MHILHHYKWTRSHVNQKVSEVFQRTSTELGVSPMAKKGASQLRSTCVLRNSMKVIKTMDGAFLLLSKILGTKGIHSSLSLWTTNRI